MARTLSESLAVVGNDDLAARVLRGLFAVMPFAPSWEPPKDLLSLAARHDPARATQIAARAEELAREEGAQSALATFDFLDKSDKGIAVFTGLRGAVKAYQGDGAAAMEMDPQQAADAGLKAAGLGWVAFKLFTGKLAPHAGTGAADKLRAFTATETGRALLLWYVSADLVLPFADNLAQGGADAITGLLDAQAGAHAERLAAVAGPEAGEAAGMFRQMLSTVQSTLGQAATYAAPLTAYTKEQLPSILSSVDKATGVVATGVDVLSTWRCLGNALVAEVCVARAAELVAADVEEEHRQAEIRRADEERLRKERERASAQQESYTLDEAVAASSLRASPIKVTRSSDVPAPAPAALPEKKGCLGCGAMVLLGVLPLLAMLPLVSCAHHIAPPEATAAYAPAPPTHATKVCWVEMAQGHIDASLAVAHGALDHDLVSTQSGLLVVHPSGTWLLDAGSASSAEAHIDELHGLPKFFLTRANSGWTFSGTIADAVRRAGADPATLAGIVPTHGHFDHLGGIVDLPGVPVIVPEAELAWAKAGLEGENTGILPAEARALVPRARTIPFAAAPVYGWAQSWDVFGDGSVVVWPMPGHTPGSVGIRVGLPDQRTVVLVGDTVWAKEGFEQREPKGWLASSFDFDGDENDTQIARLWALHQATPELPLLPAHDRRAWEAVFGQPGCVGA